ncbi:MAG: alpha/beta hydrolase [Bryobacteraceae bacterium]|jgi:fermentation-respiration switch protein FrsA (DUF1100 family)
MLRIPWFVGYPLVGACGYGVLYLAANRAVYYPSRYPNGWWQVQAQVAATDVWLRASDGVRLHAWWIESPGARIATLFLHGNAGNITHRVAHIREITAAGSSVLVLDYRGYGKSEGRPTERGLYADAEAGYEYLRSLGKPIVAHGESLGSAVAVDLAAKRPCAGVVLEAPFPSARAVAASVLPVIGPLLIFSYNSASKIQRVHAPLLFIHGDRDSIVPLELGRALFNAAREPKAFWTVPGADHNDLVEAAGPRYRERLREFYAAL